MTGGKRNPAMLVDLYELTMAACYYRNQMFAPATFSLFIRDYPPNRGYLVSAGLEEVLDFLETFHFESQDLDFLESTGLFGKDFLRFLAGLRFTGDVWAIPEGRLFFKDEPILEVTGPIIEAQLVETFILNAINLQVSIATKASRCFWAARGRRLIDFSLRRTQGPDAGMKVARSSYLAGFDGTSNVLAGQLYGIPVSGTMAHSFVISFHEEIDAFRAFAEAFPDSTVLLIDTYDTLTGARKAAEVAREMARKGKQLKGVRLDSGDMTRLSQEVREIFKREGLGDVSIFASGGFDEYKIDDAVRNRAEIDGFGVGTKMGTSADSPYTDMAYKLVQYDQRPVLKLSTGKKSLVSQKQVFRFREGEMMKKDIIGLRHEVMGGEALLRPVMKEGRRLQPPEDLESARKRFREELRTLDEAFKALENPAEYLVEMGAGLEDLQEKVIQEVREKELGES